MAITSPQGIDLQAQEPLELKTVKQSVADMLLISRATRYEGLKVYVRDTQQNYQLIGGIEDIHWTLQSSSSGHTIQKDSISLLQRGKLNFIGNPINITDDFLNDATVINITEQDPLFTAWEAATDYALMADIPTALADLSDDTTHRLVTDTEKIDWNNKVSVEGDPIFNAWITATPPAYPGDIPDELADLAEDMFHRVVTDSEKAYWNAKVDAEVDPVFISSPAYSLTLQDITNIQNLSGVNTGDQDLSGFLQSATNGLTEIGSDVQLGGALTKNTTITAGNFEFRLVGGSAGMYFDDAQGGGLWFTDSQGGGTYFEDSQGGGVFINGASGTAVYVNAQDGFRTIEMTADPADGITMSVPAVATLKIDAAAVFTDLRTTKVGLEYAADYSATYTNRSLVDKEYVDNNGGGGGGGHTIQNEGTPLTARANLNFVGAAVAVTDDVGNNATVVTINETDPLSLHLDQTTPQSVINGMPIFTGITFNNSYSPTGLEPIGSMFWDEANATYSTKLKNGVTLQNGQELHIYGKNTSGQPIVNGQPVSIDSVGGQFTAFTTVDITTPAAYAYVGLATQDIAINGFGYVTIQGVVRDINTNAYDEGKPVYVGPDGLLTKVFPTVPNYIINVGIVEYKHGTNGRINIVSAIVPKLQDLSDVNGTPLNADGLIPVWNNTGKFFDFTENIVDYAKLNTAVSFDSVYTNDLESSDVERAFDAKMGTGIPSEEKKKFKLTTSYATGNLTASIEFVGGYTSFSYYINNRKFTVTAANIAAYTQTAAASEGLYFFYINQTTVDENAPAMALTKTPWVINDPDVLLWNMYFEATGNTVAWVGNEKHTFGRDIYNHARNHAQGAVYQSGFIASAYNGISSTLLASNTDNSPARAILQVSGGYFFDEDIKNGIAHSDSSITSTTATPDTDWDKFVYQFLGFTNLAAAGTNATTIVFPSSRTLITGQSITVMNGNTQTLRGYATVVTGGTGTTFTITSVTGATTGDAIVVGGRIPIYYISSAAGGNYIWRRLTTTDFLGVSGGAAITPSTIAAAVCQYNNTSTGGFTNMTANRYFPMYLLATNFTSEPVIAVLGQGQSTNSTLNTALGEAPFQFNNLVGLNKLELQEVVPFYRLTFHYNTTGAFTTAKFKLVNTTFIDVRVSTSSGAILTTGAASDHALLSNREWIAANHTSNQTVPKLAAFDAAGAPVYSDMVVPYYDATVGTGGDYATIYDAFTAGKLRLLIISDLTLTNAQNISALSGKVTLHGKPGAVKITITVTQNTGLGYIFSPSYMDVQDISFIYSFAVGTTRLFQSANNVYRNCDFEQNASIGTTGGLDLGGFFYNCTFKTASNYTGLGHSSGISASTLLQDCIIKSGSAIAIYLGNSTSAVNINNLINQSTYGLECLGNSYAVIYNYTTSTQTTFNFGTSGLLLIRPVFTANITMPANNYWVIDGMILTGNFATAATGKIELKNCRISGTLTISTDYCKITNCIITGLTTLAAGAEYNLIQGNTLTGGLTNSSGNTTNIVKDNF